MMGFVRAKKFLGQHFLKDHNIARKIVGSLSGNYDSVLEIGPGTGILTQYLLEDSRYNLKVIEIDRESVQFLNEKYPSLKDKIISADFLTYDINSIFKEPYAVIGNFPYNISTQILFKVLEQHNQVPEVVGMFQKEVAERLASGKGSKKYGIISVLIQAYYDIQYLFTVNEDVFAPPPKVKSAVIRLTRNNTEKLPCDELLFIKVVKTAFNQRRKTLRNALKSFVFQEAFRSDEIFTKRAEQLSVEDFVKITNFVEQ